MFRFIKSMTTIPIVLSLCVTSFAQDNSMAESFSSMTADQQLELVGKLKQQQEELTKQVSETHRLVLEAKLKCAQECSLEELKESMKHLILVAGASSVYGWGMGTIAKSRKPFWQYSPAHGKRLIQPDPNSGRLLLTLGKVGTIVTGVAVVVMGYVNFENRELLKNIDAVESTLAGYQRSLNVVNSQISVLHQALTQGQKLDKAIAQ